MSIVNHIRRAWLTRRLGGVTPAGYPLPPAAFRMGGTHFYSDGRFLDGALRDVRLLENYAGLSPASQILDFGCGAGRLAIGILERYDGIARYVGIDVQHDLVSWARRFLGGYPGIEFVASNARNDRYNPRGREGGVHVPAESRSFDIVYAYSVFSHMLPDEVEQCLHEMARVLRCDGRGVFTAFVKEGAFEPRINPSDYGSLTWEGPLHCVLLSSAFLDASLAGSGLVASHKWFGTETDGQSMYVVAVS